MGDLSRKRGFTLKPGAVLPDPPRLERSPGIVRHSEADTVAAIKQVPVDRDDHSSERAPDARPSQASRQKPLAVNIRVSLDPTNMERAQEAIATMGGSLAQLVNAVARNLQVGHEDFNAVGVVAPRERLSDLSSVITCKIDRELYEKWAQKSDPFGVMRPGDVARGAVNHAFNRAASQFLQELLK